MGVHVAEGVEGLFPLVASVHVAEKSVGGEVGDRSDGRVLCYERPWEGCAEVDGGNDVVALRVHVADRLAEPALIADLGRLGGVPDVHRAEVGAVGYGVADAVDDGDLAVVVQVLDRAHRGVEAVLVVQRNYVFLLNADVGPVVDVLRVGVRDNAVEIVVAARELDYDELAVLSCTHSFFSLRIPTLFCVRPYGEPVLPALRFD